ncbi:MAG: PTS system mannose/fructose/N-acetylgalactosamine-transporter subunit IIB [Holdemania filiformis]
MIVQLRIDERLIHGQVAAAWARALDITHIVCASDAAAGDALRSKVLLMTTPPGKKVFIKTVEETIRLLDDPRADRMKIFLITDNPSDAVKLVQALPIRSVNVANYHKKNPGTKIYLQDVCVTDQEELPVFEKLAAISETIVTQLLPSVEPQNFKDLVKKAKAENHI